MATRPRREETFNDLILENTTLQRSCPQKARSPSEFARLMVLSTPLRGLVLEFDTRQEKTAWILGSGAEADFVVSDSSVHGKHLYFEKSDDDWMVTSHPDCWGFLVNNEPVETAVIEDGDRLRVGRHEMIFVESKSMVQQMECKASDNGWRRWFKRGR